jgi:carbon storage regulator
MMFVLSRKQGEGIAIGGNVQLTVVAIQGNRVRLGVTAPPNVPILREQLGPKAADLGTLAGRPGTSKAEP